MPSSIRLGTSCLEAGLLQLAGRVATGEGTKRSLVGACRHLIVENPGGSYSQDPGDCNYYNVLERNYNVAK